MLVQRLVTEKMINKTFNSEWFWTT